MNACVCVCMYMCVQYICVFVSLCLVLECMCTEARAVKVMTVKFIGGVHSLQTSSQVQRNAYVSSSNNAAISRQYNNNTHAFCHCEGSISGVFVRSTIQNVYC